MTLVAATRAHDDWVRQVYEESFPASVRAPWAEFIALRPDEELLILQDSGPVGFVLLRHLGDTRLAFLRYVAVDPRVRGKGAGSRLIQQLQLHLRDSDAIVLDVEDPAGDPSHAEEHVRRIAFYERLGFTLAPVAHYAPPDHGSTGEQIPLLLMGTCAWDNVDDVVDAVYRYRYGVTSN